MAARSNTDKVTVTIDGVQFKIPPGVHSLRELAQYTGLSPKLASLTVVSAAPAQASSVPANGSYNYIGGEVFTSTVGA